MDDARSAQCAQCGQPETDESTLLRCSRCKCTYYCSPEHQRAHWPSHRSACLPTASTSAPTPATPAAAIQPPAAVPMTVAATAGRGQEAPRVEGDGTSAALRVCMIAPGSRGDVVPLVVVGKRLRELGCRCARPQTPSVRIRFRAALRSSALRGAEVRTHRRARERDTTAGSHHRSLRAFPRATDATLYTW